MRNFSEKLALDSVLSCGKNKFSEYVTDLLSFYEAILSYTREIFKVYGNELELLLQDYNLLTHPDNCLSSSTAIGYVMEEFLVSKLEIYTQNHTNGNGYRIQRKPGRTTDASYDCFSQLNNAEKTSILINLKACRSKGANNAVAAITQLYKDYVESDPDQEKGFLILKVVYDIHISKRDNKRKIGIVNIDAYFLEEYDLYNGHTQDYRAWSKDQKNRNSGRLQMSDKARETYALSPNYISYRNTFDMIKRIYTENME